MKRKVYIERSTDGRTLFFRPGSGKAWDMSVDLVNGSKYMFEELLPGEGRFYHITPVRPVRLPK